MLTEDVVFYSDGGGRVKAAFRPIRSALYVARFLKGVQPHVFTGAVTRLVEVNGDLGVLSCRPDGVVTITAFAFEGERIKAIYTISNPEKLGGLAEGLI